MSFAPSTGIRAYAKINLGLEVLGRRDDGYHELRTILQTIDFYDELDFAPAESGVHLTTSDPGLPTGEDNLVFRAASRLAERSGYREGVAIRLRKHVPAGAGLGGGSADAAATLRTLDRLWDLRASREDLHELASELGMDVPFFLHGGTALAVGRGDEVYPLRTEVDFPIVLILPDFSISTASVYRSLRLTTNPSGRKLQHFAWDGPRALAGLDELVNELEEATGEHSNSIQEFKKLLIENGATASMMSGSGSAVFGVFRSETSARRAVRALTSTGLRARVSRTVGWGSLHVSRSEGEL